MSSSLYWRPVPKEQPPTRDLPYDLKKAISQRFWGHDGSLYGDAVVVDASSTAYFQGLVDGGREEVREGAAEVLAAIREHGAVELWIAG